LQNIHFCLYLHSRKRSNAKQENTNAKVAQLVEHDLAKVGVASSNLVFRSNPFINPEGFIVKRLITCSDGGTGRHAGLKILFPLKECGFDSRSEYLAIDDSRD
jgi:hypothetical protein